MEIPDRLPKRYFQRRLFRFEGPGRHTQPHIARINQEIEGCNGTHNAIIPEEKILPDHSWDFRPKIRG